MADDLVFHNAIVGNLGTDDPNVGPPMMQANIINNLEIPIALYWLDALGNQLGPAAPTARGVSGNYFEVPAKGQMHLSAAFPGWYVCNSASTGAFVWQFKLERPDNYTISRENLRKPNDIGRFPVPTPSTMIPVDSPRVLVACGTASNGNYITREQYWRRTSDSYALAPGQKHTVGFSTTSGMEQTSSTQNEVSQQLGLSASAGWGPVSASVSASLSMNSTTFQQVTVTTETTRYETIELENKTTKVQVILKWQLIDIITIFDKTTHKPTASIIIAQSPVLLGGPYDLNWP
jgi:hypothetical protein